MNHRIVSAYYAGMAVSAAHKSMLLFAAFILAGLLAMQALAQVAPQPELQLPAIPPTSINSVAKGAASGGGDSPHVRILGWSTSSEVEPTNLLEAQDVREDPVLLDAGHAEIALFFGASPSVEGAVFRYRLDNYDTEWTETREHAAHYRRLPPGTYRFEVQALSSQGEWTTPETVLRIEQKPFFYQTWYAYVLIGIVVLVVAAQLLHQHDQLLKGQIGVIMEERNRIASDCHDTLMAGLAAVSWQLEATAKLFRKTGTEQSLAATACELARSMVSHCQAEARRIIWDLRNETTITNSLSEALGEAIGVHRLPEGIPTTIYVHGGEIPIAPGAMHHLVCIGQEAVANAIRHSRSTQIKVELRYESSLLSLSIRDDGQGFKPYEQAPRDGHFGISVMEERARKLGGQFRLSSLVPGGTEVTVTVGFHRIHQPASHQHVVRWIGL